VLVLNVLMIGLFVSDRLNINLPFRNQTSEGNGDDLSIPITGQAISMEDLDSCEDLGGDSCNSTETCAGGVWMDSLDSFSCCSIACNPIVSEENIEATETFELNLENEELGDLI